MTNANFVKYKRPDGHEFVWLYDDCTSTMVVLRLVLWMQGVSPRTPLAWREQREVWNLIKASYSRRQQQRKEQKQRTLVSRICNALVELFG